MCIHLLLKYVHILLQVHLHINANTSNFKVSECMFPTDGVKQGTKFDVILVLKQYI